MSLPSSVTRGLDKIPNLAGDENWQLWEEGITRFVRGAGASYIVKDTTTEVPKGKEDLDEQIGWQLYGKVEEKCRGVLKGKYGGWESWVALKEKYEKSTMSRRYRARKAFYRVHHDPNEPIDNYITSFTNARDALKALKIVIDDIEAADVLLMNLDPSCETIRTTILAQPKEQTFDQIIATITTSVPSASEFSDSLPPTMAYGASMFDSSDPYVALAVRHGLRGVGRSGGGSAGNAGNAGGQGGQGRVDEKGYRWCDVTNENHCHRCGRPGHIAALCMYAMPDSIKDWIMASAHRAHVANTYDAITQPSAHVRSATTVHTASAASAQPISVNPGSNYVPPHRRTSSRSPSPTFAAACHAAQSADDQDDWEATDENTIYGGVYSDGSPVVLHI